MRTRAKAAVVTVLLLGGITTGIVSCGGGGGDSGATAQDRIRVWQQATTDDPGFQAVDAEVNSGDGFDTTNCDLSVNDTKAFADHHPAAPYGEKHWQKALDNLSKEIRAACDGDLTKAAKYEQAAADELDAAQEAMTAALHGKPMPSIWD